MKKIVWCLLFFYVSNLASAQSQGFWKKITLPQDVQLQMSEERPFEGVYELEVSSWTSSLQSAVGKSAENTKTILTLPNSKGAMEQFLVWEASNFDPQLQAQYPTIRSFYGRGITDTQATVYFSTSGSEVQTMILRSDSQTEFMEPIKGDANKYVVYQSDKRAKGALPLHCSTEDKALAKNITAKTAKSTINDRVFRTLRLALSCTAEYTAYHGGTVQGALAAMNATMTRVNGVFNRDLALRLVIIADNEKVIFTNASTDPYTAVSGGEAPISWNQELQTTLTNIIGEDNYDIGHLFGASGGGGNAGCIGCICEAGKGSAYTSPSNNRPEGDLFDIDFVAHEFGHQLGATHTFSFELEGEGTSVEPGSGTTIMGYAGVTDYNVQSNSDDYFVYASIKQIHDNLITKQCPVRTTIPTTNFTVDAGADFTIPKMTPFSLKATATGTNLAAQTYVWEQNDSASTSQGNQSIAFPEKIDGPMFRSLPPTKSLQRYFPEYEKVVSGQLSSTWESLSSVSRDLTFVVTARDNAALGAGQTASDTAIITVDASKGPFAVTSQNTVDLSWNPSTSQTVTWSVNGTNTIPGAANVNIKLSTDGGKTFPTVLANTTPNDGSEVITVPAVTGENCRILIEPTGNVFYAINATAFAIGYTTVTDCKTYVYDTPIAIPDGVGSFTTREIVVPANLGSITDVNVVLGITHSYLSDVEVEIVSPQKTTVKLLQRNCGSTSNTLVLTFDDNGQNIKCADGSPQTVTPAGVLSSFNGQDPAGVWILRVRDVSDVDSGTINNASVSICTKKATLATEDFAIADFKLFPNPSNGNFKIEFSSGSNNPIVVSVVDLLGRKVYHKAFENTGNFSESIDLKKVTPGIYVVNVEEGNKKQVQKIVVE